MSLMLTQSGWTFAIALALAMTDWITVARQQRQLERIFKPATLTAVLIATWLLTRAPHDTWQAPFFLTGLALSLAGDVLLMLPRQRFFIPGLAAFFLAHVCYIAGLNPTLPSRQAWVLLVPITAASTLPGRRITKALQQRQQTALRLPVLLYSVVISLMLFSAWATLFRADWSTLRRALAITGASLFFASDTMLAWERFIARSTWLKVAVMVTYHLGQIGLAASISLLP